MKLAVSFGAGASYGCGALSPGPIPLGAGLYDELRSAFPESWGSLIESDEDAAFRDEPPFEKGMERLRERNDERLVPLLSDMARFFAQFEPTQRENLYGQMLDAIGPELLESTVFGSLNYDCLLELIAGNRGFQTHYSIKESVENSITLLKPHGSCNFVMKGFSSMKVWGNTFSNVQAFYEGPLEAMHPKDIEVLYAGDPGVPPAISLYGSRKENMTGPSAIEKIRDEWAEWVGDADLVIVIGVRVVFADPHVWDPILDSNANVWFAGGKDGDYEWLSDSLGFRLRFLAPTFEAALPIIAADLRDV